jgi:hypothetical protein
MKNHLTGEQIRSFAAGGWHSGDADLLVHLGSCSRCFSDCLWEVAGRTNGEQDSDYDGAVARAVRTARRHAVKCAREERAADKKLVAYLDIVENHNFGRGPRLSGWALCRKLLELSKSYRHKDAQKMLRFANCAQSVVGFMDTGDYPAPVLADFQALVDAALANAYRVNDVLSQADDYLQSPETLLDLGT